MEHLEIQIAATVAFLTGETLLIFKKKFGWVLRQVGLIFLVAIYLVTDLRLMIVPTITSMIVGLSAYLKWRKDDKKKQQEKWVKGMTLLAKTTELSATHGLILATPAKEVKRMKLRQIEKELEALQIKKEKKNGKKEK